jgi:hypothetical protein
MPPARFITKEFIASLLTSEHSKHVKQVKFQEVPNKETIEIEISDDEEENENIVSKTTIESEENVLKNKFNRRKEAISYIESKLRNVNFCAEDAVTEFAF